MQNRKENKGSLWCLLVRKRQCSRERVNTPLISPQSVTCFQINVFWVEFPHSVSKSRRNLKECFSALKVKGKKDNERLLEYTICMSLKENSSLLLHRSRFASSPYLLVAVSPCCTWPSSAALSASPVAVVQRAREKLMGALRVCLCCLSHCPPIEIPFLLHRGSLRKPFGISPVYYLTTSEHEVLAVACELWAAEG